MTRHSRIIKVRPKSPSPSKIWPTNVKPPTKRVSNVALPTGKAKPKKDKTLMFFCDAYTDEPATKRGRLTEEVRRLKMLLWADGNDAELREMVAAGGSRIARATMRGAAP